MAKDPTDRELASQLGDAKAVWDSIDKTIAESHGPVERVWKPSKLSFGRMCLLKQKKRTLLYMTPEKGEAQVAVVLGERAVALALESKLPERIKTLLKDAKPYVEGRGIRFAVKTPKDVDVVNELVKLKLTPK